MHTINIGLNEKEQRLDRFLTKYLNGSTKTNIFRMIRVKAIRVNGKKSAENYMLQEGDVVTIHVSDEALKTLILEKRKISPTKIDLDIVYEDDEILVVCKPAGLLTHPDKTEYKKTLSTYVQLYLEDLCTRTFRPAPVHRLDKNTSGLVLFAKTYDSLKKASELMRTRVIEKYYLTIVEGKVTTPGKISGYVVKDRERNKTTFVKENHPEGLYVDTEYRSLEIKGNRTLLEVKLNTGRSHQIRVSLAHIGFPIIGDSKYGGHKQLGKTTQVLHAYKLVLGNQTFEKRSAEIDEIWNSIKN